MGGSRASSGRRHDPLQVLGVRAVEGHFFFRRRVGEILRALVTGAKAPSGA
jgi:hypothetical protein